MEYNIKQGANLPELIFEILFNTTPINYKDRIKNASITMTIYKQDKCTPIIYCDELNLIEYNSCDDGSCSTFYLVYKPKKILTKNKGEYYANIQIKFLDNDDILILPEKNYIKILVN